MTKNKFFLCVLCVLIFSAMIACPVFAGVKYFPGVTTEMSSPDYWSDSDEVLMTYPEIYALNQQTINAKDTFMYDLKNQPDTVDGISLNEALLKSTRADASYYLGWTYIHSDSVATQEDFDIFINNTQNPNPKKEQKVLYAVAVKRTELRTFPSETPIWDDPKDGDFDYQYLSAVRVNEPLVITSVSADGKFYLAKNVCCSGWIKVSDVAVCNDREQWLEAWDIPPEKALVVYGDKVYVEKSVTAPLTSELMLTMGTVLEVVDVDNPNMLVDNRSVYQNYVVWIPVRNIDGTYSKKMTLISEHQDVNEGYLELTEKNIAKVAFSALGNTYGWGGSLFSDDCSGYIRNVYKCFGLELARNTTWQSAMPMQKISMQSMCCEDRVAILDALPIGTILYFNGHEMLYLGRQNDKYYVVSSISSVMQPENPAVRQRIRSIVINTLDVKRSNGNTWLDDMNLALVPYWYTDNGKMPQYTWYHNGVSYCIEKGLMQGDENKMFNPDRNVTFAELLQIIWNNEGKPGFVNDEVSEDKWYDRAVEWAVSSEIVDADKDVSFEEAMTREAVAEIIYFYAGYKGYNVKHSENLNIEFYSDFDKISDLALPAVKYVVSNGIMNGKTQTTFNPKDYTTRAEVAQIIKEFCMEANEK